MIGTLKTWRGTFGFLSIADRPDTFVHQSQFGGLVPKVGAVYEFDIVTTGRGPAAEKLKLASTREIEVELAWLKRQQERSNGQV